MPDSPLVLESWLFDTYGRRALQRVREVRDTQPIPRGGAVRQLPEAPVDLGGVELVSRTGATITLDEHLETSFTEGLIVLQDGAVVFERYRNGLEPDTLHLLASVTKSLTASVLGIAIAGSWRSAIASATSRPTSRPRASAMRRCGRSPT